MARCYRMAGGVPGDAVQITPLFGLFNGGFGMYHGARAAGLFVIPAGPGNTQRQIRLAKDLKTRILTGVVSYGIRIMEVLEEMGEKLPDLEVGIFGAEAFSESMKKKIADGLGIEVFDIYGMTETGGVGTLGRTARLMTACTSGRITTCWRSSTRRPVKKWPTGRRESWWSPPSPARHCR